MIMVIKVCGVCVWLICSYCYGDHSV